MDLGQTPITFILIAANVIFSLIGFSNQEFLEKTIGWPYFEKKKKQYYRFITSGFLHADWAHLFFNMFTLYFFGTSVEKLLAIGHLGGGISYLALYFLGMIAADLPGYFKNNQNYNYRSLGASGAVSAVVFATIVFGPWNSIYLYGALKISMVIYAILYLVYCVYAGRRQSDNVNHDAHLWGSVFGLAFMLILMIVLRPDVLPYTLEELKQPSIMGRDTIGPVLRHLLLSQ